MSPVPSAPEPARPLLNSRLAGFGTTIFAEMSALAARTGSVNLGQGFPDTDGPAEVSEAAVQAIRDGHNQYPPGPGIPELRAAISRHQRRFWDLDYDPDGEVLVTAGATEALAATFLALCEPGDEVITFEPYYDAYAAGAAMAGAAHRSVTLRPPDYGFDPAELEAVVTPRSRLVLLNSPHNPTGKVFSRAELEIIASLCRRHDLLAVTDEVYEHLVFDGEHVPLASLPGMRERTVTISSAGKTFSFTGWKIGWVCAPGPLVRAITTAKQFLTFVNGAPFQHAIVVALDLDDSYYAGFAQDLRAKRDRLCAGLVDAGFEVFTPAGTYFVTTDIRSVGATDGIDFCLALPERCGVVAVPNVVFYDREAEGRHLVRFAFCKRLEVLDEAVVRLKTLASS
ncbi:MAG: pyridoxal phosphate-dependent aminotransferase [Acidimicrobiia bacterium]